MQCFCTAAVMLALVPGAHSVSVADPAHKTFRLPADANSCQGIVCPPTNCFPNEEYVSPDGVKPCCTVCAVAGLSASKEVKVATSGVGPATGADLALCHGVHCPEPACPLEDQELLAGRCCATCK
uniref:Uncharacterized protein n=1 Tax=Noctiluca scintillans TaxID=2966 RepID=A0A7S1ABA6_NOCSC